MIGRWVKKLLRGAEPAGGLSIGGLEEQGF